MQWGRVQKRLGCDTLVLMYLIYPFALLLQCVIVPFVDHPGVMKYFIQISLFDTCVLFVSGLAAFSVNYTGFLVLGGCSALTHVILGQGKSAATMLGAYLLFAEMFPAQQLIGAVLAMFSIALYTKFNLSEISNSHSKMSTPPNEPRPDAGIHLQTLNKV